MENTTQNAHNFIAEWDAYNRTQSWSEDPEELAKAFVEYAERVKNENK